LKTAHANTTQLFTGEKRFLKYAKKMSLSETAFHLKSKQQAWFPVCFQRPF